MKPGLLDTSLLTLGTAAAAGARRTLSPAAAAARARAVPGSDPLARPRSSCLEAGVLGLPASDPVVAGKTAGQPFVNMVLVHQQPDECML
jgi:hypothetical protein